MDRSLFTATTGAVFLYLFLLATLPFGVSSVSFKIVNKCRRTVWPGLLSGANTPQLSTTGFSLRSGESRTISVPQAWSGRIWGRTLCGQDAETGQFSCITADCGSGKVECAGGGAKPPATLAEFTLNGAGGLDFYDVSLVDGYNLPMLVIARGKGRRAANASASGGSCSATGCLVDLNGACPSSLKVASGNNSRAAVACRSACEAFGDPQYCCSGAYSTPDTCAPSPFSLFFKNACPRSYSYAYDDKTSTYTCASGGGYTIIFCPLPYTSQKVLSARKDGVPLPLVNKTTMYLASKHPNAAAASSQGPVETRLISLAASVFTAHLLFPYLLLPS